MPTMSNQRWDAAAEASLRALAGQGFYLRKLALRLRRSESSIKKRARLLDVPIPPGPRSIVKFR